MVVAELHCHHPRRKMSLGDTYSVRNSRPELPDCLTCEYRRGFQSCRGCAIGVFRSTVSRLMLANLGWTAPHPGQPPFFSGPSQSTPPVKIPTIYRVSQPKRFLFRLAWSRPGHTPSMLEPRLQTLHWPFQTSHPADCGRWGPPMPRAGEPGSVGTVSSLARDSIMIKRWVSDGSGLAKPAQLRAGFRLYRAVSNTNNSPHNNNKRPPRCSAHLLGTDGAGSRVQQGTWVLSCLSGTWIDRA